MPPKSPLKSKMRQDALVWAEQNPQIDEFIVEGYAIHDSWRTAWPQAVARAWRFEYAAKAKNNCISKLTDQIRNCITNCLEKKELNDFEKSITTLEKGTRKKDFDYFRTSNRVFQKKPNAPLCEFLDELPPKLLKQFYLNELNAIELENDIPQDPDFQADFTWYKKLMCHKSDLVLDALMEEGFILDAMANPPADFERYLSTRIIVRKPGQEYLVTPKRCTDYEYKKEHERTERNRIMVRDKEVITEPFLGSRKNGWKTINGIGHVLILTLPNRPPKPEEYGLAITDYEAAGRIYPFSCT